MKKIVMLMIVAVLMLGVSGQAMASFDQGDLIRVVYNNGVNGTGNEVATDLGNFSNLTTQDSTFMNNTTNTFSQGSVGASSWSNVSVAYFIINDAANGGAGAGWTSGPATNGGKVYLNSYWNGISTGGGTMLNGYQIAAGGASSFTMAQSNQFSYWTNMNGTGVQGSMGGFVNGNAEANLAALSTTGYVDQVLYYYGSDPDNTITGTKVATLRTFADGHTMLNPANDPSATPIPAAAYLFGTGLMGLIGLRRKISA